MNFEALSYWEKRTFTEGIDFLIIGAGISGISTAIEIKEKQPKAKVVVLERSYLPNGASTKNAGFACIGSPSELLDDLEHQSEAEVFATVEKRYRGLQKLRERLGDEALHYKALGAHEIFSQKEKHTYENCLDQLTYLNQQLEPICGMKQTFKTQAAYCEDSGFIGFTKAISHAAEAQLEPDRMMQALQSKAQNMGVKLLFGIEVKQIEVNQVKTQFGALKAEKIGLCTNGLAARFLKEEVKPARTQVVVTSLLPNLKWQGIHHFEQGYYYFRNVGERVLLGGGRNLDFEAEQTEQMETTSLIQNELNRLLEEQLLPGQNFTIDYRWAGTMGVGSAKYPLIKALGPTLFCGVRLGGMGVAIGSLVGEELAELMLR